MSIDNKKIEMKIRKMLLSDVLAVYNMGKNESGFSVSDKENLCFWSRKQLRDWVAKGEDVLLVAETEGNVIGFVLTTFHRPTGKVTWENHLVFKKFRGSGVGKMLIVEMIKRLRAKHAKYLHFLVKTTNTAQRFYEEFGFNKGNNFTWFGMRL